MITNAKDLSPDQKAAIESLLGRRVLEGESISVRAFEPPALSDERKRELTDQLKAYFAEVDARRKPGTPEEAEDIIDGAMRSVSSWLSSAYVKIVVDTSISSRSPQTNI